MANTNLLSWEQAVLWLRDQPAMTDLVRACYFDDPIAEAASRYYGDPEWHEVRALLPAPPGSALDMGAGRGISSYALARDGWNVTALEPDPSEVVGGGAIRALAQASGLEIDVVQEWGEQLPFPDCTFQVVHCRQVLHHARNLEALCAEIARVLKPGGTMIATREHVISAEADLPAFLAGHPLHHLYGGEYAYTLNRYLSAIDTAGLRIARTLNPFESDINLFPRSRAEIKAQIARRVHLLSPSLIPQWALRWLGNRDASPGRLYSFVAVKSL